MIDMFTGDRNRMPAIVGHIPADVETDDVKPIAVFESSPILLYLAG